MLLFIYRQSRVECCDISHINIQTQAGRRTFPRTFPLWILHTRTFPPLRLTSACVAFFPKSDVVDSMQVLHGCVADMEENDKLQTLLATCCSGWRRRRRLCSAHHAASAVSGVHLKRACRHAERRRPDEAWNRGFDDTAAECTGQLDISCI